jgi:hypothetical protein
MKLHEFNCDSAYPLLFCYVFLECYAAGSLKESRVNIEQYEVSNLKEDLKKTTVWLSTTTSDILYTVDPELLAAKQSFCFYRQAARRE